MRISAFLILYFCLSSLIACRQTTTIAPVLHQAETFMSESPDSALLLLEAIQSPEKQSAEDYATWCLLLTQARDKNYLEHTSDSVINIAVRYFEKQKDRNRYALALYYKGRVNYDMGKIQEACEFYLKASAVAEENTDYNLLSLILSQQGSLYAYQNMKNEALSTFQQFLRYAELSNDSSAIACAQAYLGRAYGLLEDWKSAVLSYQNAIHIAKQFNDYSMLKLALNELAVIYVHIGQFDKASDYLLQMENLHKKYPSLNIDMTRVFLTVGNMCRMKSEYDNALVYLDKALLTNNRYTRRRVYQCFYFLYEEQKQYEKAIQYNNLYWACSDSLQQEKYQTTLLDLNAKYENEKLLNINSQLQWQQKQRNMSTIIVFLLLFLLLLFTFFFYKWKLRQKNTRLERLQKSLMELGEKLKQNQQKLQHNENSIYQLSLQTDSTRKEKEQLVREKSKLLKENISIKRQVDNLEKQIKQFSQLKKRESHPDVLLRLKQEIFYLKDEDWEECIESLDIVFDNFSKRLVSTYPKLTKDDVRCCCLIKLGFNVSEIAKILSIQPTSVSTKKQRIQKHIDCGFSNVGELERFLKSF